MTFATTSCSCHSTETTLHTHKPVFMYRHRITEIKALGRFKSCYLSLYSPAGTPVKQCSIHKSKRDFSMASGQAQQEYLKNGRRKGKTANSTARSNLELLKISPSLILTSIPLRTFPSVLGYSHYSLPKQTTLTYHRLTASPF